MKKKVLFLTLLLVFMFASNTYAINVSMDGDQIVFESIDYQNSKDIRVVVEETQIQFDVNPQIINGRTLVPMRAIFEAIGLTVNWDNSTQTASGSNDENSIAFTIGKNKAIVNDQEKGLDVPASIINSRTMVPLRFLSENMGYNVVWVGESNLILMSKNNIVEWRYGGYETIEPFKEYEVKYVNGARVTETRYNGKNHNALIEWRFGGHETIYPYKEYEIKYMNGVKTFETRYTGNNWNASTNIDIFNLTDTDIEAAIAIGKMGYENANKILQENYTLIPEESEYNMFIGDIYINTPYLAIMQQSVMAGEYGDINNLTIEANKINKAYSLNETIYIPMTYNCSSYENPKYLNAVIKQGNKIYNMRIEFDNALPKMTSSWPDFPAYYSYISLFYDNKTSDKKIDLTKPAQLIIEHISGSGMKSIFDIDFSKIK